MPNKTIAKSIVITLPPKTYEEKVLVFLYALTTHNLITIKALIEEGLDLTRKINLKEILKSRSITIIASVKEQPALNTLFLHPRDIADLTIYEYQDKPVPLIYYAALKGSPECVAYLLKKKALSKHDYVSTLTYLIMKKVEDPGVLYLFLKKAPQPEQQFHLETIVKHHAHSPELITALLGKFEGYFNANLLLTAAYPNDTIIKLLVERYEANINAKVFNGLAPLHKAIQDRNTNLVHKLLALKADPTLCANNGLRPLDLAVNIHDKYSYKLQHNQTEIEQLLKAAGASDHSRCEYLCYNRMLNAFGKEHTPREQLKLVKQARNFFDYTCS